MLCNQYGWTLNFVYYEVYPTDLIRLKKHIIARQQSVNRTNLIIAYNSRDQELTQTLLDQWSDGKPAYINSKYNKQSMDMFKRQVNNARNFA